MFPWCFKMFQVCCKKVLVCFKEVSGVCWEYFKIVSRKLLGLIRSVFKGVWSKLQTSFEVVSRVFPEGFKQVLGYFMEVSRVFSSNIFSRILWKFQESYKKMLKVLQRSFILHVTHRSYLSRVYRLVPGPPDGAQKSANFILSSISLKIKTWRCHEKAFEYSLYSPELLPI